MERLVHVCGNVQLELESEFRLRDASQSQYSLRPNPYRILEGNGGALQYGTGAAAGLTATVDWDYGVGPGLAHNFLEMCIDLDGSLESSIGTGGLGLHWTMQCGNDVINVADNVPLAPPPVPEPSTLVLLGMGALGVVLRTRRPTI